ncbi:L-asparaginase [Pseudonocardia thermophila]|uniref:asparaginase n=2 Tax=Pseudonocardia thermophila TaxID=1848 RepID=A0A1M6PMZ3_PSETH|nr:L-asparaginase [Pseudonocardia thermophila]
MLPEIVVLGTGGTISAVADARGRNGAGLSAGEIVTGAGALDEIAVIRSGDVRRIPGRAMTPQDMHDIALRVGAEVAAGCSGVVITHGTDTIEETVYALALMLDVPVPVVMTGAMRLPADPGHDGGANLRTAVVAATRRDLAAFGPLLAFGDELHLARWVTKQHTSRPAAFASPETGPAGVVVEGRVLMNAPPADSDHLGLPDSLGGTRVELVWIYAGADGALIEAAAERADGIVVAGTGGGHTPPSVAEAIGAVVAGGTPVVVASRCAAGPTLHDTYGGPGGEAHLRGLGAVHAGRLPALKARLRLQVALALGRDVREVFPR